MKLSAYIIRFDSGFAPNPFGHFCTLACCKPRIRLNAEPGDIVVGTAATRLPHPGHLVYAMRVKEVLPYEKYWKDARFASRKPTPRTRIRRCGDNIWHRSADGKWVVADSDFHNQSHRKRDTSGKNAVIATEFYYFGRDAIAVPQEFKRLLAKTQGHKNTREPEMLQRFWNWVCSVAPRHGRIADPSDFSEEGCRAQSSEIEDEDFEEC